MASDGDTELTQRPRKRGRSKQRDGNTDGDGNADSADGTVAARQLGLFCVLVDQRAPERGAVGFSVPLKPGPK